VINQMETYIDKNTLEIDLKSYESKVFLFKE
jgi:hypothetical protein